MSRIVHVALLIDLDDDEVADGVSEFLTGAGPDYLIDWSYAPADRAGTPLETPGQAYDIPLSYTEGEFDATAWPA